RVRDSLHDQPVRTLLLRGLWARAEPSAPITVDRLVDRFRPAALLLYLEPPPGRASGARTAAGPSRHRALHRRLRAGLLDEGSWPWPRHGWALCCRPPPAISRPRDRRPRGVCRVAASPRADHVRDDALSLWTPGALGGGALPGEVRRSLPQVQEPDRNVRPLAPAECDPVACGRHPADTGHGLALCRRGGRDRRPRIPAPRSCA